MMWFKCKYNRYQNCDIDEPDTECDGCETGLKYLEKLDDYDDDPHDAYHRWRDDKDMKEQEMKGRL